MTEDQQTNGVTKRGWTVTEWRLEVGISSASTWRLIRDHQVKAVKMGRRRLITTPPAEFLANLPPA
jgi:hypothetical protein